MLQQQNYKQCEYIVKTNLCLKLNAKWKTFKYSSFVILITSQALVMATCNMPHATNFCIYTTYMCVFNSCKMS